MPLPAPGVFARPLVIAHRGASAHAPENTWAAFDLACQAGADAIECDVHATAVPGHLVVHHDATVDRCTDGSGRLADLAPPRLARLDAGAWRDPRFAGERVPSLGETITRYLPRTAILVERKSGEPAAFLQALAAASQPWPRRHSVCLQSFDWEFLEAVHGLAPSLALAALGEGDLTPARLHQARAIGAGWISWRGADLARPAIQQAHQLGFRVLAWTIDDPDAAARLLADEVDGWITNDPAGLRQALRLPSRS